MLSKSCEPVQPSSYDWAAAPRYEWCNAFSMALALYCGVAARESALTLVGNRSGWTKGCVAMLATTALHLPVSFGYHAGCALRCFADRVDNAMRMADQTMVLVACVSAAYCTSASVAYAAFVCVAVASGVPAVWSSPTTPALARRRQGTIAGGVALYLAPTAMRAATGSTHELVNLVAAVGCFVMGEFGFIILFV